MHQIQIVQGDSKHGKGRVFVGTMATFVQWSQIRNTAKDTEDPIFLELCATEGQLRPLCANLRTGRDATFDGDKNKKLILNKTSPLVWTRPLITPAGAHVCAYLPDLFDLECGMIHESHARFVVMPSVGWVKQNVRDLTRSEAAHVRRLGMTESEDWVRDMFAVAVQFCARLDTRTNLPLIPDRVFKFALMAFLVREGLCKHLLAPATPWPTGYHKVDTTNGHHQTWSWQPHPARFWCALGVQVSHQLMAEVVASVVKEWDRTRARS